jgi:hypothetical protein
LVLHCADLYRKAEFNCTERKGTKTVLCLDDRPLHQKTEDIER